jgi:hypothetical protein
MGANPILSSRRQSNTNFMPIPLKVPSPSIIQPVVSNYKDIVL